MVDANKSKRGSLKGPGKGSDGQKGSSTLASSDQQDQAKRLGEGISKMLRTGLPADSLGELKEGKAESIKEQVRALIQKGREGPSGGTNVLLTEGPGLGDRPFHLLFLPPVNDYMRRMAKFLISEYNEGAELVNCEYTGWDYRGEVALHMCCANRDLEMVEFLLLHGADVLAAATGRFFDFGGEIYYGELPLSFAVSVAHEAIVRALMQHMKYIACDSKRTHLTWRSPALKALQQGDGWKVAYAQMVNAQDCWGNTALHLAVYWDSPTMYDLLLNPDPGNVIKGGLPGLDPNMKNVEGLTPLLLAAKLGKKSIFLHILHSFGLDTAVGGPVKRIIWQWGPVQCVAYKMNDIDSVESPEEAQERLSNGLSCIPVKALTLLVHYAHSEVGQHLDILGDPFIHQQLIMTKWQNFGQTFFRRNFLITTVYVVSIWLSIVFRPDMSSDHNEELIWWYHGVIIDAGLMSQADTLGDDSMRDWLRVVFESVAYLMSAVFLVMYLLQTRRTVVFKYSRSEAPLVNCMQEIKTRWALELAGIREDPSDVAEETITEVRAVHADQILSRMGNLKAAIAPLATSRGVRADVNLAKAIVNIAVLLALGARCAMQPWSGTAESLLLCISSMMASLVLVVDIRGFSVMGDSNVHEVIRRILCTDFLQFLIMYVLMLFGFVCSFNILFKGTDEQAFNTTYRSFVSLIRMTLGEVQEEQFFSAETPTFAVILFVLYVLFMTVLLLNLVIAMMGETFRDHRELANSQATYQKACLVVGLEDQMSRQASRAAARVGSLGPDGTYELMIEEPIAGRKKAQDQAGVMSKLNSLFGMSISTIPAKMLATREFESHLNLLVSRFTYDLNAYIGADGQSSRVSQGTAQHTLAPASGNVPSQFGGLIYDDEATINGGKDNLGPHFPTTWLKGPGTWDVFQCGADSSRGFEDGDVPDPELTGFEPTSRHGSISALPTMGDGAQIDFIAENNALSIDATNGVDPGSTTNNTGSFLPW